MFLKHFKRKLKHAEYWGNEFHQASTAITPLFNTGTCHAVHVTIVHSTCEVASTFLSST